MLTLASGYARLDIPHDEDFARVSESIRSLMHVCRLNHLRGALVVSQQDAYDWRSSMRVGIRFAAARGAVDGVRLALVARHFNDSAREDVLAAAREAKLECRIFRGEEEAIAWLGGGQPPSGESKRAQ